MGTKVKTRKRIDISDADLEKLVRIGEVNGLGSNTGKACRFAIRQQAKCLRRTPEIEALLAELRLESSHARAGTAPDKAAEAANNAESEQARLVGEKLEAELRKKMRMLDERPRLVLEMYFFGEKLLREIGDELKLTRERVRQIKAETLEVLYPAGVPDRLREPRGANTNGHAKAPGPVKTILTKDVARVWAVLCDDKDLAAIEKIKRFYGLANTSSAVRLAIRVQAGICDDQ